MQRENIRQGYYLKAVLSMLLATFALLSSANAQDQIIKNRWQGSVLTDGGGGAVTMEPASIGQNARWQLEQVGQFVRLRSVSSGNYLHVENGPLVLGPAQPGWWSAMWIIEQVDGAHVRLRNRWRRNLYIHIENGRVEAGPIQPGWWSAMWRLERPRGTVTTNQPTGTQTPPGRPVTPPVDQGQLANEIVTAHNELRARHGVQALTWSPALAASSNRWALTMKANGCTGGHSGQRGVGENLAWSGTTGVPTIAGAGRKAVQGWYWCEIGRYDPANPGFSMATGHYTQVVWAATTQVGCAIVSCDANEQRVWPGRPFAAQVVVCQYSPSGNVTGQFPQNVRHINPGPRPAGVRCN